MIVTGLCKHLLHLASAFALLLLLAIPALAQQKQFVCSDETDRLDCTRIEAAAQPLLGRGAAVAIYMVQRGDSSGADFVARLRDDQLATGDTVDAGLVAIYVSLDPRYAELRGGDRWNAALLPGDNITSIRTTKLVPALAAGMFTDGFIDTLVAIDQAITSPPQPGASSQPTAGAVGSTTATPLALSIFGVAALAGGGYAGLRWRKARLALAEARWRHTDSKQAAGAAIVELGRALQADRDKAEYDQLSYSSTDVEQLAVSQRAVAEQFAQIQARFDDIEERIANIPRPQVADYTAAAAGYAQSKTDADTLHEQLSATNQLRQELDALAKQAPGAIEQARARLASARQLLDPLAGAIDDCDAVLAPLREQIAQAEAALESRDARRAIEIAHATAETVSTLGASAQSFGDLQARIRQGGAEADVLERQGYHVAACSEALNQAQAALEAAAAALQHGGPDAAASPLGDVTTALERAAENGPGLLTLRAENDQRLLALGVRAHEVTLRIEAARQAFEIVDEFAESIWSDIRGNGSEAEASAAQAARLWRTAAARNTISAQEFAAAREDLNAAEAQLARASSLAEAIIQRLKDLEHARAIAQDELAAAAADVAAGKEYLGAHDADVGKGPEQQLGQAADLLAQAQAQAQQAKPDWLALVRLAQAANAAADTALAGARSQVEAIDKARALAQHAQQLAASEVQRAQRFRDAHRDDISWDMSDSLHRLNQQLQAAYGAMRQAEGLAEEERLAALERARSQFTSVDSEADRVYARLYADFQRAETARQEAEQERRRSSSSSWSSGSSSWSSGSSRSSSGGGGSWGGGGSSGGSWGGGSKSGGGW
jgi:uncharacterized membrane protein YgcG